MKFIVFILTLAILFSCQNPSENKLQDSRIEQEKYHDFKLDYLFAGMGSMMGNKAPVFRVKGTQFIYTYEQTSSRDGKYSAKPDTLCIGKMRESAIDSIIYLVKDIKDTLIRRSTLTMSGGIDLISIRNDSINIRFDLWNAYDTTAGKIINILNSNIHVKHHQLSLSNCKESDDDSLYKVWAKKYKRKK